MDFAYVYQEKNVANLSKSSILYLKIICKEKDGGTDMQMQV